MDINEQSNDLKKFLCCARTQHIPFVAAVLATVAVLALLLVGVATEGDAFSFEWPLLMLTIDFIFSIFDTDEAAFFFGGDFTDFFGTAVLAKGGFGFVAVFAAAVFGFTGVATLMSSKSSISSLDAFEVVNFRCVFTAVTFACRHNIAFIPQFSLVINRQKIALFPLLERDLTAERISQFVFNSVCVSSSSQSGSSSRSRDIKLTLAMPF